MAFTTIDDGSAYFQTLLYTGDGTTSLALTFSGNSDLQPDLVWNKERAGTGWHIFTDTSRGLTKTFYPNDSNAEETYTNRILSIQSDGFTIGNDTGTMNKDNGTYANWCWKGNGGTRTTFTESGNNPGGGYQVNNTSGFSMVDYTGTGGNGTIAHGMTGGKKPTVVIIKNRDAADAWAVGFRAFSSSFAHPGVLDTNAAFANSDDEFNDSHPGDTTFSVGTNHSTNADGEKYMAYLWAPIQGFSQDGSYKGNGLADGPFIYTGFKPAWLMIKMTDSTNVWQIYDNKRGPNNPNINRLNADVPDAESTSGSDRLDFLSNGFKLRATSGNINSANDYVYLAFAEHPFVSSKGVPCTAR
tara:strand:- start:424 stop:1491 length:1068 start_codon:yes stop_codon:yes gene_type:complete